MAAQALPVASQSDLQGLPLSLSAGSCPAAGKMGGVSSANESVAVWKHLHIEGYTDTSVDSDGPGDLL